MSGMITSYEFLATWLRAQKMPGYEAERAANLSLGKHAALDRAAEFVLTTDDVTAAHDIAAIAQEQFAVDPQELETHIHKIAEYAGHITRSIFEE